MLSIRPYGDRETVSRFKPPLWIGAFEKHLAMSIFNTYHLTFILSR